MECWPLFKDLCSSICYLEERKAMLKSNILINFCVVIVGILYCTVRIQELVYVWTGKINDLRKMD